jgi:general stress protein 26
VNIHPQQQDTMNKVAELVKGINVCMLTAASCGRLISHPMNPLELDSQGDFWFFASHQAVTQLDLSFINIGFSDEDRAIYISLSGRAELLPEQARIEARWSPLVKSWFAHGKDDPDLALVKFSTHTAAYWDAKSSKMVRLLASIAATKIERPLLSMPQHAVLANAAAS